MRDYEHDAHELGRRHGVNLGSWVIDGNTDEKQARWLVDGYEAGDPEVMDMQPAALSGEWADGPSPRDVFAELGWDEDESDWPEWGDDVLESYEQGFSEGFWDEVTLGW